MTTASRTCGSSARTARRRSRRTAAATTPIRTAGRAGGAARCSSPQAPAQRYCSHSVRRPRTRDHAIRKPERRKVERPPYDQLMAELAASNYSAVGRKYGVSDNAVRKWVRWYEQERLDEAA